MQFSSNSFAVLIAGLLAWVPAVAQPAPAQKQDTQGEGPPMVGPASGAYREHTDPNGWDADARAGHKQQTDARDSIGYVDQQRREADQHPQTSVVDHQ